MAGYLDQYGVTDAKRERRTKHIIVWGVLAVIVAVSAFFYFRNWPEEREIDRFFTLLRDKQYQQAYQLWDSPETRRFYPPEKFIEDWGESGVYKNPAGLHVEDVDNCGDGPLAEGVVFNVAYPGTDNFGLWVERSTKVIKFAPWNRCPGPHLQVMEFLKSHFGGGK